MTTHGVRATRGGWAVTWTSTTYLLYCTVLRSLGLDKQALALELSKNGQSLARERFFLWVVRKYDDVPPCVALSWWHLIDTYATGTAK